MIIDPSYNIDIEDELIRILQEEIETSMTENERNRIKDFLIDEFDRIKDFLIKNANLTEEQKKKLRAVHYKNGSL